ncbi:hypothetical protein I4U23_004304 [Adineta vaga]|nr:hypothetical protein I4U23_004304 [Adineta vaga]
MTLYQRKLLVLDIDGTMIFAEQKSNLAYIQVEQDHHFKIDDGSILVWKRPGLDEFVEWCFEHYDIGIWSASSSEYVHSVLACIIPDHLRSKLKFIWTSIRCTRKSQERSLDIYAVPFTIKRLQKLWRNSTKTYNRRNTLILDDTPTTYQKNYGNAIPIISYSGSIKDCELERVKYLLESLISTTDDLNDNQVYPYGTNARNSEYPLVPTSRHSMDPQFNQMMNPRRSDWNAGLVPQQKSSLSISHIPSPQYGSSSAQLNQSNVWGDSFAQNKLETNPNANKNSNFTLSKFCAKMTSSKMLFFVSGFILAAIPLAVFVTLWINERSKNVATTTVGSVTASTTAGSYTLPIQCYSYMTLNDVSRNVQNSYSCCYSPYDTSLVAGWYRVSGSSGTQIATTPIYTTSTCGSSYPGYFNGSLPSTIGGLTTGNACFYTGAFCGYSVSPISAMNCSGYYIFYLVPTSSTSYRYCTTS